MTWAGESGRAEDATRRHTHGYRYTEAPKGRDPERQVTLTDTARTDLNLRRVNGQDSSRPTRPCPPQPALDTPSSFLFSLHLRRIRRPCEAKYASAQRPSSRKCHTERPLLRRANQR